MPPRTRPSIHLTSSRSARTGASSRSNLWSISSFSSRKSCLVVKSFRLTSRTYRSASASALACAAEMPAAVKRSTNFRCRCRHRHGTFLLARE